MPRCKHAVSFKDNIVCQEEGVDPKLPFVFFFDIEGAGMYVGKYKSKAGLINHHHRKLRHMCDDNTVQYRRIYTVLHKALHGGKKIRLVLLENNVERMQYWKKILHPKLNDNFRIP